MTGQAKGGRRDRPWLMRTYSGHSSAKASNELYRKNLAKGQTGLSVAFDLPTQTGYDADHPLARGEVGRVGVPICSIADMETLFEGIPIAQMNTSMTINATAPWLLALYVAAAERQGATPAELHGTTQNDIIKEYLSRGTYIFPPRPSLRLTSDMIAYTVRRIPKWNPINVCSYHLQEAGATPVQELAYALSTAIAVLDAVRDAGEVDAAEIPAVVARISFFVNAGIRFVEECCKIRAFTEMWDALTAERYGVTDGKSRRFRYGVQVNSLGLTEQQPENNVQRIVLEMLAVVLSKSARARAVQLPAWNEALGLPRPWDQQWSLRIQQVMAFETDLLEYGDILDGSPVIAAKVDELIAGARAEMARIEELGGMVEAIESGYVKRQLVASHTARLRAIESGEQVIVGVNAFRESEVSPLTTGSASILKVDGAAEREQIERLRGFRGRRNPDEVELALCGLVEAAKNGANIMEPSIRCAHAGVTTGEWAEALRDVFGDYRPATGIDIGSHSLGDPARIDELRRRVRETSNAVGRHLRLLVAKPGLDGHSNGAEQIAVKARDAGFEVIYDGIRLTPAQIAVAAMEEGVHLLGLSVLSGSHLGLVESVLAELRERGLGALPIVLGGIIPDDDADELRARGVAAVYTPKDVDMNRMIGEMVDIIRETSGLAPFGRV
ncbi:MAG: protein meaA [Myxococcales bacterium]|nr:protein meaA [Myxococcales bacterium]